MRLGRGKTLGDRTVSSPHSYAGRPKRIQKDSWDFTKKRSRIGNNGRDGSLECKYENPSFWCREYYVDTAGKNTKNANMIKEDELHNQLTMWG